jgi:hypothetical protein
MRVGWRTRVIQTSLLVKPNGYLVSTASAGPLLSPMGPSGSWIVSASSGTSASRLVFTRFRPDIGVGYNGLNTQLGKIGVGDASDGVILLLVGL